MSGSQIHRILTCEPPRRIEVKCARVGSPVLAHCPVIWYDGRAGWYAEALVFIVAA